MKDRNGFEYADLIEIQRQHLDMWRERLISQYYVEIEDYVLSTNTEANDSTQKHQVYRGQDLIQIIMDWPNLCAAYPPLPDESDPTSLI